MRHALLILIVLCLFKPTEAQDYFSITSYNVENLFDTIHDEGKNDQEFLPDSERKWNSPRLWKKLKQISKVIADVDKVKPCDVVGMCEVENDTVIHFLTRRSLLRHLGYEYVMTHSLDERGIDVALLYSPMRFRLIRHESLRSKTSDPTRDVLYVCGSMPSGDTLDIYMVHLPSKLGGMQADKNRKRIVGDIIAHAMSVTNRRQTYTLVVMGDFNEEMKGWMKKAFYENGFTDMMDGKKPGTYKYRGLWSCIDHMMVKTNRKGSIESGIHDMSMLLEKDKTHGDKKPRRTYLGTFYHGGISDHLPIWAFFYF